MRLREEVQREEGNPQTPANRSVCYNACEERAELETSLWVPTSLKRVTFAWVRISVGTLIYFTHAHIHSSQFKCI